MCSIHKLACLFRRCIKPQTEVPEFRHPLNIQNPGEKISLLLALSNLASPSLRPGWMCPLGTARHGWELLCYSFGCGPFLGQWHSLEQRLETLQKGNTAWNHTENLWNSLPTSKFNVCTDHDIPLCSTLTWCSLNLTDTCAVRLAQLACCHLWWDLMASSHFFASVTMSPCISASHSSTQFLRDLCNKRTTASAAT